MHICLNAWDNHVHEESLVIALTAAKTEITLTSEAHAVVCSRDESFCDS